MNVLFVCYGNIIRSQMAEGFYRALTGSTDVASAGVSVTDPLRYNQPLAETIQVMQEEGIDVSSKKPQVITPELVEWADEIYVLNSKADGPMYLQDSPNVVYWKVEDPFGQDVEKFRVVRDQIKMLIESILPKPKVDIASTH